jgi:hypothetical protein
MSRWHKTLTQEKWSKFSLQEQLLMIGTEILRAKNWLNRSDFPLVLECYERALELIDLTVGNGHLNSEQRKQLLPLREAIGFLYVKKSGDPALCQVFYNELVALGG